MSKEMLKNLIDIIAEDDIDTIFKVLIRFIPEDEPLPDEIEAIAAANTKAALYTGNPDTSIHDLHSVSFSRCKISPPGIFIPIFKEEDTMKIEKLPSGSYRNRKMYRGKMYCLPVR